jgi:hypothetical protein
MQTGRPDPFALGSRQKIGHGPAHLAGAHSGAKHPGRAGFFIWPPRPRRAFERVSAALVALPCHPPLFPTL